MKWFWKNREKVVIWSLVRRQTQMTLSNILWNGAMQICIAMDYGLVPRWESFQIHFIIGSLLLKLEKW